MASTRDEICDRYPEEELLFADGFDNCIIGVAYDFGNLRVVYSIPKMVETLFEDAGMPCDEAMDYLEFNTLNAWIGDQTPIYLNTY